MTTIRFPTPKNFTVYWRPESVDRELGIGAMFDHVPSEQLVHIRAARGDTLWLVTADDSNRLFLAGRLKIDKICDRATVRRTVKGKGLWDASHHAFAARLEAEPYRKLILDSTKLQFV